MTSRAISFNPMLAAALSVSTRGHLLKIMLTLSLPVSEAQNLHKKEKPLRGNALSPMNQ